MATTMQHMENAISSIEEAKASVDALKLTICLAYAIADLSAALKENMKELESSHSRP